MALKISREAPKTSEVMLVSFPVFNHKEISETTPKKRQIMYGNNGVTKEDGNAPITNNMPELRSRKTNIKN